MTPGIPNGVPQGLVYSERGFKHLPAIRGTHSETEIKVYESSCVEPSVWVSMEGDVWTFEEARGHKWPNGDTGELTIHLPLEDATRLRDHLTYLIDTLTIDSFNVGVKRDA